MYKNQDSHYLYASTLHVSDGDCVIQTVLGSCIAVCIWDKVRRTGGMNHFMLPYWDGKGLSSPKYGNVAIPRLVEKLIQRGSRKADLVAKVFGGAEMISFQNSQFNIGKRNAEITRDILKELDIPIAASSIGGNLGRKIYFRTEDGAVHMKFLKSSSCKVA